VPETPRPEQPCHFDVLIVGAGISGVGAGYHLKTRCPQKTYAILETREQLGGTWDVFRYPGIRSDSDMHTLGYSFRPWTSPRAIADGASILSYLRETAEMFGIDRHIRYGHRVERASWSSADAKWTVLVRDVRSGGMHRFTCRFLYMCSGYYDCEQGHTPEFAGVDRFRGRVVHPQAWPSDLDYEGKRVVVIGSGATAISLVPELAKRAAHVTMLQRSPTYMIAAPGDDPVAEWLAERLPAAPAYAITRWKNLAIGLATYAACRRFPGGAKKVLLHLVRRQLGPNLDLNGHFTPSYKPWDQRPCLVLDGDLFRAMAEGRASIATDHIETFTESGLRLRSGAQLDADLVVTATGLNLKFLGGLAADVDGLQVLAARTIAYKGMMLSDVPNLALAMGYTNASWTLKSDLTSKFVCRLLAYMDKHGHTQCCPRRGDAPIEEAPLIDLTASYVRRGTDELARQGKVAPWKLDRNYALERIALRYAPIADGALQFSRPNR
jgi:monooxygenase